MYYTITKRNDGFGAQYQNIIFGILYTELCLKGIYIHKKIEKIEHNYNNDPLFLQEIENLMNLHSFENEIIKNVIELSIKDIYPWVEQNIDYCLNSTTMKKIRKCFWENKVKTNVSVAIHIRRLNCMDDRIEGTNVPNEYFLNKCKLNKNCCIYSQGDISQFKEFENHTLYLNENVSKTFIDLVSADILVTSPSSFSYTAALLNENIIYYYPFWHKPSVFWKNGTKF